METVSMSRVPALREWRQTWYLAEDVSDVNMGGRASQSPRLACGMAFRLTSLHSH